MPNILVADDHDLVRDTIAAYLGQQGDFTVSTASGVPQAQALLAGQTPFDLVILDYNMPGMDGLSGLESVVKTYPHIKVVLMSGIATPDVAQSAMEIGAKGFLPKSATATSMVNAIRFVLSGEQYFPFDFTPPAPDQPKNYKGLSPREMETLQHLCNGASNKEIARALDLAEVTVKLHVKNILAKLSVNNRTQAALMAKADGTY
ncbi:response regulator transcription factor [Gymnodinialimonas sp. 57CJ19]|uniref:response regulator transcription factor n=1 Tax=Gymnodinialimonas sp. 57CJ19 TaxID=3138498 RepID=UPI00313426F9